MTVSSCRRPLICIYWAGWDVADEVVAPGSRLNQMLSLGYNIALILRLCRVSVALGFCLKIQRILQWQAWRKH